MLALVALLLGPGSVQASEGPATIVLVADHADAEVVPLLRAELESLGLRVLVVANRAQQSIPSELNRVARQNGAIAAFRVLVAEGRVEVWLADRVTGKVLLREVLVQTSGTKTGESVVVARAVELLRASLLELDVGEPPHGEVTPPPPVVVNRVVGYSDERERFGLYVGGLALLASKDINPAASLEGRLTLRPAPRWGVAIGAAVPVTPVRHRVDGIGVAELTPRWFSAGGRWEPDLGTPAFGSALEIGMGLLWTHFGGVEAEDGYVIDPQYSENGVNPVPYARAEGAWILGRTLQLRLGVGGGPGLQPQRLLFGDDAQSERVQRSYGRFLLTGTLGLEVIVP